MPDSSDIKSWRGVVARDESEDKTMGSMVVEIDGWWQNLGAKGKDCKEASGFGPLEGREEAKTEVGESEERRLLMDGWCGIRMSAVEGQRGPLYRRCVPLD